MKAHKEKLRVIIVTTHHQIKGEVHLYENSRLTDILNAETATKDFLPVTNAIVTDLRTGQEKEVAFLSLNRTLIEMVLEDDEVVAIAKAKEMIGKRKYPEALPFAQRAAKAAPTNAEAHYLYGFCLAKSGEARKARAEFEKCLALKPSHDIVQLAEELLKALP